MVLLYQDSEGEQVGITLGMATNMTPTRAGTTVAGTKVNLELESKVASLEKLITELRNENEALKTVHVSEIIDNACGALSALLVASYYAYRHNLL